MGRTSRRDRCRSPSAPIVGVWATGAPTVGSTPVLVGQVPPDVLEEVVRRRPLLHLRAGARAHRLGGRGRDRPTCCSPSRSRSSLIVVVAWVVLRAAPPGHRPLRRLALGPEPADPADQADAAPHADRRPDPARQRARHRRRVDPGRRPGRDARPRAPLHRRVRRVEHRRHHGPRRARHQPRAADRRRPASPASRSASAPRAS